MSKHGMSSEQASNKKRDGHKREQDWHRTMNPNSSPLNVNYSGSSADCTFEDEIPESLSKVNPDEKGRGVSIKSGNTLQFNLGSPIPELTSQDYVVGKNQKGQTQITHGVEFQAQVESLRSRAFWNKYLKKGDWLAYYDSEEQCFAHFSMEQVIDILTSDKFEWDLLDTGRIKGRYCRDNGRKEAIVTYEYRKKKKSFVLGAHGGTCGKKFIDILKENLPYYQVAVAA